MTARDAIAAMRGELQDLVGDAAERDDDDWYMDAANAILAAGYSKPRTITTAEELDALPSGSVIIDSSGEANVFHDNGWVLPGGPGGYTTWAVAQSLPATVLYEPQP